MPTVSAYHRPSDLDEALALLAQPGTAALAGGTALVPSLTGRPVEVVDLQALGLGGIEATAGAPGGSLRIGAMTTLQALADDDRVPAGLRDLARRELPSTLRTLATVGGTVVAAEFDSELLAGLLVHEAVVTLAGPAGAAEVPLPDLLAAGPPPAGTLVVAVTIATAGTTASARTARTTTDRAIVAAAARKPPGGPLLLALSGVAGTPVLVASTGDLDLPGDLDPPGDFRGSSEYRRHLAGVLAARVRAEVA